MALPIPGYYQLFVFMDLAVIGRTEFHRLSLTFQLFLKGIGLETLPPKLQETQGSSHAKITAGEPILGFVNMSRLDKIRSCNFPSNPDLSLSSYLSLDNGLRVTVFDSSQKEFAATKKPFLVNRTTANANHSKDDGKNTLEFSNFELSTTSKLAHQEVDSRNDPFLNVQKDEIKDIEQEQVDIQAEAPIKNVVRPKNGDAPLDPLEEKELPSPDVQALSLKEVVAMDSGMNKPNEKHMDNEFKSNGHPTIIAVENVSSETVNLLKETVSFSPKIDSIAVIHTSPINTIGVVPSETEPLLNDDDLKLSENKSLPAPEHLSRMMAKSLTQHVIEGQILPENVDNFVSFAYGWNFYNFEDFNNVMICGSEGEICTFSNFYVWTAFLSSRHVCNSLAFWRFDDTLNVLNPMRIEGNILFFQFQVHPMSYTPFNIWYPLLVWLLCNQNDVLNKKLWGTILSLDPFGWWKIEIWHGPEFTLEDYIQFKYDRLFYYSIHLSSFI